jgi:hypothetical protein
MKGTPCADLIRKVLEESIEENFKEFGLLKQCKKCLQLKNGCRGQYNAPGLTYFWCAHYDNGRKKQC